MRPYDTRIFLSRFLPKGTPANRATLSQACRTLHLAFKGADSDEIYDILVMCLLKAIQKWDPKYSEKVNQVVHTINDCFSYGREFTIHQVNDALGFNASRIVRMLARKDFLEPPDTPADEPLGTDMPP